MPLEFPLQPADPDISFLDLYVADRRRFRSSKHLKEQDIQQHPPEHVSAVADKDDTTTEQGFQEQSASTSQTAICAAPPNPKGACISSKLADHMPSESKTAASVAYIPSIPSATDGSAGSASAVVAHQPVSRQRTATVRKVDRLGASDFLRRSALIPWQSSDVEVEQLVDTFTTVLEQKSLSGSAESEPPISALQGIASKMSMVVKSSSGAGAAHDSPTPQKIARFRLMQGVGARYESLPARRTTRAKRPPSAFVATNISMVSEELALVPRCFYTTEITYLPHPHRHPGLDSRSLPLRVGIDTGSGLTWLIEKGVHCLSQIREEFNAASDEVTSRSKPYAITAWPKAQELLTVHRRRAVDWTHALGKQIQPGQIADEDHLYQYLDGDMLFLSPLDSHEAGDLTIIGNEAVGVLRVAVLIARAATEPVIRSKSSSDGIFGLSPYLNSQERGFAGLQRIDPLMRQLLDGSLIEDMEFHWWHPFSKGHPHLILGSLPEHSDGAVTGISPWLKIFASPVHNQDDEDEDEDEDDDADDDDDRSESQSNGRKRDYSKWLLQLTSVRILQPDTEPIEWEPLEHAEREGRQDRDISVSFDTASYCSFLPDDLMQVLSQALFLVPATTVEGDQILVTTAKPSSLKRKRIIFRFSGADNSGHFDYEISGNECIDKRRGIRCKIDAKEYPGSLLQSLSQIRGERAIWGVRTFRGLVASFRPQRSADISCSPTPTIRLGHVPDISVADLRLDVREETGSVGAKRRAPRDDDDGGFAEAGQSRSRRMRLH